MRRVVIPLLAIPALVGGLLGGAAVRPPRRVRRTATEDSLLLGFGLEQLSTDAERVTLVERALSGLLE